MKTGIAIISVLVLKVFVPSAYAQDGAAKIDQKLVKAVVRLQTSAGNRGSGFLFALDTAVNPATKRRAVLLTNKHMLGDWNLADGNFQNYHNSIDLFSNWTNDPSGRSDKPKRIALKDTFGRLIDKKVLIHPDPKADVALIALEEEISPASGADILLFDSTYLLNLERMKILSIGVGDRVFAIGYPAGVPTLRNNYPTATPGNLASVPGDELSIAVNVKNHKNERIDARVEGKILLVSGLAGAGNSGAPVLLPADLTLRRDANANTVQFPSEQPKDSIIGIVSSALGSSRLTTVYSADYIQDLLDLFLQQAAKK